MKLLSKETFSHPIHFWAMNIEHLPKEEKPIWNACVNDNFLTVSITVVQILSSNDGHKFVSAKITVTFFFHVFTNFLHCFWMNIHHYGHYYIMFSNSLTRCSITASIYPIEVNEIVPINGSETKKTFEK